MELIERYIYAVTLKLHEKQRSEIEQELRGLIEDMLEDHLQGREATQKDVEEVLAALGEPGELADKYRGYKRYLIGPELFPLYLTVMKVVLASVGIAMLVVFCIEAFLDHTQVLHSFVDTLVTLISACFQAFAWVTIAFGFAEFAGGRKDLLRKQNAWKPADLPLLPDHRSQIKRSDPIASIVFTILFAVLLTFAIDMFGVWRFQSEGARSVVPFFNEAVFRSFLPYIIALLGLTLIKDSIKLITGKWTIKLLSFDLLITALHLVLALFMFSDTAIWNADFMAQMTQAGLTPIGSEEHQFVSEFWNFATANMLYIMALILVFGMVSPVIRMYRLKK